MKNSVRIIVGLALLVATWALFSRSQDSLNAAREKMMPGWVNPLKEDTDFFDRPDARTVGDSPAVVGLYHEAMWLQRFALLTALAGAFLILLVVIPVAIRALSWLLTPDFLRDRLSLHNLEPKPEGPDKGDTP